MQVSKDWSEMWSRAGQCFSPHSFSPIAEWTGGAEKAIVKHERASFDIVKQVLDIIGS